MKSARHGIRTHNALKALHLDHLFGSASGGCVPKAKIDEQERIYQESKKDAEPTKPREIVPRPQAGG